MTSSRLTAIRSLLGLVIMADFVVILFGVILTLLTQQPKWIVGNGFLLLVFVMLGTAILYAPVRIMEVERAKKAILETR